MTAPKTYDVRTHGCQMNVHDSERLAGLLETAGYVDLASVPAAERPETADVVVFNTCAVRENADNKLYGNLGQLRPAKTANPDLQIAVGGCMAQKDRESIVKRAPWVDVVFGTHNIGSLPALLDRARHNKRAEVEILESLETFPSTLPTRRDSAFAGWVSISVGCNNTCTFCIVPSLRGKEADRRPGEILAEIEALVAQGVIEITLLGQNVNTYGVEFGDRFAFGKLLRACGEIEGLERVRFTSPHPAAFTDDVIEAMAATPNVMPSLHMPLQSGSDTVLKAMRRSYRSEKFLGIIDKVRTAIPDAAITTDIIVGFPGETEADFAETLRVVEASRFSSAFTFQYSIRPGTPAATMPNQVPKAVVQERFERLIELQERVSWAENRTLEGREVEVLVAPGEGRKDGETARLSGRARDNRLVHFAVPDGAERPRPGDVVTVGVTYGAPHHLVAEQRGAGRCLLGSSHQGWRRVGLTAGCAGTRQAGRLPGDAVARQARDVTDSHRTLRDLSGLPERENRGDSTPTAARARTSPRARTERARSRAGSTRRSGELAAAYSGAGSNGSMSSGGSPEVLCAMDGSLPGRRGGFPRA
jgi:tRNA-2-methylthio-N6-dimethylallyladenosine synthase